MVSIQLRFYQNGYLDLMKINRFSLRFRKLVFHHDQKKRRNENMSMKF